MKKIYSVFSKISAAVAVISYIAVVAATLLTVADVVLRKFFASSVFGAYEVMELLMSVTVFASFAYTQTKKGHIRVSMFIKKMKRVPAMIFYTLNELLAAFIAAAVSYAAYIQIGYSISKNLVSANLFIPIYPFYIIEMACMTLFALILLLDAIAGIIGIFKQDYADQILSEI